MHCNHHDDFQMLYYVSMHGWNVPCVISCEIVALCEALGHAAAGHVEATRAHPYMLHVLPLQATDQPGYVAINRQSAAAATCLSAVKSSSKPDS
jgi:hypothetical protein